MPMIKGKHVAPADAIKQGLCPETGESLEEDNIEDRIRRLWPGQRSPEAEQRISMLRDFDKQGRIKTAAPK